MTVCKHFLKSIGAVKWDSSTVGAYMKARKGAEGGAGARQSASRGRGEAALSVDGRGKKARIAGCKAYL